MNISQPKLGIEKFDDDDDDDDKNNTKNSNNKLRSEKFDDNNNYNNNIFKWAVARWQWLLCMYINMK